MKLLTCIATALLMGISPVFSQVEEFPEESRQFDFWIGQWDVNLRVRQQDNSWLDDRTSVANIYSILGGKAILELWDGEFKAGYSIKGYSLRYYNTEKGKWELWLNWPGKNRAGSSSLEGNFRHGRGDFYSYYTTQTGKQGISRYSFNDITANTLRWDDAFSTDSAKTWTHNWIMEFTRKKQVIEFSRERDIAHTYVNGGRCDMDQFRQVDTFSGAWTGTVSIKNEQGEWEEVPASLDGYKVLEGCAVLNFLEYTIAGKRVEEFSHKTYNTGAQKFEDTRLDNRPDSPAKILFGDQNGSKMTFLSRNNSPTQERYSWLLDGDKMSLTVSRKAQDNSWEEIRKGTFSRK